jgi:hypothetical protein
MQLILRKEKEPGDDLVSRVIEEHVRPGNLSREDFAEIGAMILRAGHDTTTNMIGLGTLILLQHPEQAAAVRDQPELVPGAVEELLRYISPCSSCRGACALEDVAIGDVVIRKGEGVFAVNPAANRDPAVFADPDTFDIHRDASHHVAFGYGIHQCLGSSSRAWSCRFYFRSCCSGSRTCALRGRRRDPLQGRTCRSTGCTTSPSPGEHARPARRFAARINATLRHSRRRPDAHPVRALLLDVPRGHGREVIKVEDVDDGDPCGSRARCATATAFTSRRSIATSGR